MMPLTIKQQKFSKLSAKMNPEIQAIQAKYKNRKDQGCSVGTESGNSGIICKVWCISYRQLSVYVDPDAYSVCSVSGNLCNSCLCRQS